MNLTHVVDPETAFAQIAGHAKARAVTLEATGDPSIVVQFTCDTDPEDGLPIVGYQARGPHGNRSGRWKLPGPDARSRPNLRALHTMVDDFERWSRGPEHPCPTCLQARTPLAEPDVDAVLAKHFPALDLKERAALWAKVKAELVIAAFVTPGPQ